MWFIWLTIILIWFLLYVLIGMVVLAVVDIFVVDGALHTWLAAAPKAWMADLAIALWPLVICKLGFELYQKRNSKDGE